MSIDVTQLSKFDIKSIMFDGIVETSQQTDKNASRVSAIEMRSRPSDTEKSIMLRKRLGNLWHEKTGGSYPKLEYLTLIKQNTFQSWSSGKRKPSRLELAKFVVGLSVDIDTADELFSLQDHSLDCMSNRFDYIVACAIKDRDDIEQFGNDLQKHCGLSIF